FSAPVSRYPSNQRARGATGLAPTSVAINAPWALVGKLKMHLRLQFLFLAGNCVGCFIRGIGDRWSEVQEYLILLLCQLLFAMQFAWRLFVYRREMQI